MAPRTSTCVCKTTTLEARNIFLHDGVGLVQLGVKSMLSHAECAATPYQSRLLQLLTQLIHGWVQASAAETQVYA